LLTGLSYYVADQSDRAKAIKRGAGQAALVFDSQSAEGRYRLEPVDDDSPDRVFERRWALALLDQVLQRLEKEFIETGRGDLFERLQVFLVAGRGEASYAEAAAALGMSQEAVRKAVQRLRLRYQELFREEIAHTVANPEEVEEELRHLSDIIATC
jgi:RNA polymerase sigma-70 factor (ECF subfamily)